MRATFTQLSPSQQSSARARVCGVLDRMAIERGQFAVESSAEVARRATYDIRAGHIWGINLPEIQYIRQDTQIQRRTK